MKANTSAAPGDAAVQSSVPEFGDQVSEGAAELRLLGGFRFLRDERPIRLSRTAQRVVAFLAVKGQRGEVTRDQLAGTLWPEIDERQAHARLRTELWRLRAAWPDFFQIGSVGVSLDESVVVDFIESKRLALSIVRSDEPVWFEHNFTARLIPMLASDLLPGWYEDWIMMDAERWRQQRLHALETLAQQLTRQGRYATALDVALAALSAEPLRESALIAVVRIHLAEGNKCEAIRACGDYRKRLWAELQLMPSQGFEELVQSGIGCRG